MLNGLNFLRERILGKKKKNIYGSHGLNWSRIMQSICNQQNRFSNLLILLNGYDSCLRPES